MKKDAKLEFKVEKDVLTMTKGIENLEEIRKEEKDYYYFLTTITNKDDNKCKMTFKIDGDVVLGSKIEVIHKLIHDLLDHEVNNGE